jgi:hypothetical protein
MDGAGKQAQILRRKGGGQRNRRFLLSAFPAASRLVLGKDLNPMDMRRMRCLACGCAALVGSGL